MVEIEKIIFKVAVIGAGVSGLLTARDLHRNGLDVVVYEKSDQIGGTWVYTPEVEEDDLLGLDPNRKIVHSSLYHSLRTNLPPVLMEFIDYPFDVGQNSKNDYFPGHEIVLEFLQEFARHFGLENLVRFNTEVFRVEKKEGTDQWLVKSRKNGEVNSPEEQVYDAVVVCTGHHTKPRVATDLPGMKKWPGKQIHSHNYRTRDSYKDQVVVVIGAGPSAYDIAFDIAEVAKEVHLSSRHPQVIAGKLPNCTNVWQHRKVENCHENGEVSFEGGAVVLADIILHCTGFLYDFPFLETNGIVTIEDNRVGPLYKHVFPPELAPNLSFVGIPKQTVSCRMMELQARWVAHVLAGKGTLPSKEEMLADVKLHYSRMEENGIPKHHSHTLPLGYDTYMYLDWVAAQIGLPPADEEQKLVMKKLVDDGYRQVVNNVGIIDGLNKLTK